MNSQTLTPLYNAHPIWAPHRVENEGRGEGDLGTYFLKGKNPRKGEINQIFLKPYICKFHWKYISKLSRSWNFSKLVTHRTIIYVVITFNFSPTVSLSYEWWPFICMGKAGGGGWWGQNMISTYYTPVSHS